MIKLERDIKEYFATAVVKYFVDSDSFPNLNFSFDEEEKKDDFFNMYFDNTLTKNKAYKSLNESGEYQIRIRNFDSFFDKLKTYCEKELELSLNVGNYRQTYNFVVEIIANIFLRATVDDFNDIDLFLDKQIEMLNINELSDFLVEQEFGNINFLDDLVLSAKLRDAYVFDENSLEMVMRLTDRETDEVIELPLVRFGIYNKDEKRICSIGSIQNKFLSDDSKINAGKKEIISQISRKDRWGMESKKIISLLTFMFIMNKYNINDFEIHGLNILDYRYHELLSEYKKKIFEEYYPVGNGVPTDEIDYFCYMKDKKELERYYQKEETIVELKTTKLFEFVYNVLQYYLDNSKITSFPFEADSNFHFNVPSLNISNINGNAATELFEKINNYNLVFDDTNNINMKKNI